MAYGLPEAIWLVRNGATDVLVAYPTVDRESLGDLRGDAALAAAITVMVDDPRAAAADRDDRVPRGYGSASTSMPRLAARSHLGVRRSPVHSVSQAVNAARTIVAEPATRWSA